VSHRLSVLIPAHNEADYIGACLTALFASDSLPADTIVEVLVLANGCSDDTVARARAIAPPAGWHMTVLERSDGGKLAALNDGDAAACGDILVYLDADVVVEPDLLPQIADALCRTPEPRYASGSPRVSPARSWVTRAYARVWQELPFLKADAPGFGLFAMSRAGRARWGDWPAIISDDTFARLHFAPQERIPLSGCYHWPMVEGFRNLVRVRRRQDQGVAEISARYPALMANDDTPRLTRAGLVRLALRHPLGLAVYIAVALAVRSPFARQSGWVRGR